MQLKNSIKLIQTREPGILMVELNDSFEPKYIGRLDISGEGTYSKRVVESKHLHRNSQSVAINAELLESDSLPFRWIVVDYIKADGSKEKLVTSRAYILAHGKRFKFRDYEPQIALELSEWSIDKARRYEVTVNSQQAFCFGGV